MSVSYSITRGYGFRADNIETTPERLIALSKLSPSIHKEVMDIVIKYGENLTVDSFNDLEGDYSEYGITYVLYNVMKEEHFEVCEEYGGNWYILFPETMPWYLSEQERNYTREDVENIFNKYVKILTDDNIEYEQLYIENCY